MENAYDDDDRKTCIDPVKLSPDYMSIFLDPLFKTVNVYNVLFTSTCTDVLYVRITDLFAYMKGYYCGYLIQESDQFIARITFICHVNAKTFYKRLDYVLNTLLKGGITYV